MRWRVISSKPNWLIGPTRVRARSFFRFALNRLSTALRFLAGRMSMRSSTTSPPRSRRRSWRAISSTASWLVLKALVSASRAARLLPLLTSTATRASVLSITRAPPLGRGTSRALMLAICGSMPVRSNTGTGSS